MISLFIYLFILFFYFFYKNRVEKFVFFNFVRGVAIKGIVVGSGLLVTIMGLYIYFF